MNVSEPTTVALISAISGIIIAYIVNVAAKKVQDKKTASGPKDRMEQMFDGYERLIRQKDLEDERKARLIDELEEEIKMTREMVKSLEHSLAISQQELERSRLDNQELKKMLADMREEYEKNKELDKQEGR